jgi:site-specific recombinase XerC
MAGSVRQIRTSVAVGLIVLGAAVCGYGLLRPPDVAGVARSAEVAEADGVAAALLERRLAVLQALAPWLVAQATFVEDGCGTERKPYAIGQWPPVRCSRSVTRVFGFDGDLAGRARALEQALHAAGWRRGERRFCDSYGLDLLVRWRWPAPAGGDRIWVSRGPDAPLDVGAAVRAAQARHSYAVLITAIARYR